MALLGHALRRGARLLETPKRCLTWDAPHGYLLVGTPSYDGQPAYGVLRWLRDQTLLATPHTVLGRRRQQRLPDQQRRLARPGARWRMRAPPAAAANAASAPPGPRPPQPAPPPDRGRSPA